MIRFVQIEKDDILTDPAGAAEVLNCAVRRKRPVRFSGLCDSGVKLIAVLEDAPEPEKMRFVFSPFPSESEDDLIAVAERRYQAGYSTLASFRIAETLWGLFAKGE